IRAANNCRSIPMEFLPARAQNAKSDAEFFAVATEVINSLEGELRRAPSEERARWRVLDLGCGSGRLMRPLSRHFLEIRGVDVAPALIEQARASLNGVSHGGLQLTAGAALAEIEDNSADFIYSYDFFRHVPSGETLIDFLRAVQRVLKPGGLARLEFAGV